MIRNPRVGVYRIRQSPRYAALAPEFKTLLDTLLDAVLGQPRYPVPTLACQHPVGCWVQTIQGGEYCAACREREQVLAQIETAADNQRDDHPAIAQVLDTLVTTLQK